MGVIKFKAEENKGFVYEPGDYIGEITAITPKTSNTGKRYYEIKLTGEGFGSINAMIFDTQFGRGFLHDIYVALGIDPSRDDVEDTELLDKWIAFTIVEGEPYNGKPTYSPTDFRAVENSTDDSEDDEW